MKAGGIRRNGAPSSDQATMTTHFIRHGDLLTLLEIIEDPIYLTEPEIVSKNFQLDAAAISPVGPPCVPGYEGTSGEGSVPHYLPGENPSIDELTRFYGIPREATLGGAETMYPEFRRTDQGRVRPARQVHAELRRARPACAGRSSLARRLLTRSTRGRRLRVMRTVVAATAFAVLVGMPGAIRARPQSASPAGKPGPKAWTLPRTPWGDPDFRGVFSNGDAYTTPLERPDRFAGRRLEDIQGQELADVRRAQLEAVIDALPGGRVRGPDAWWVQNLNVANSRQPWLVVDPPDGKIPALTADGAAARRRAACAAASSAGRSTARRTSACSTAASSRSVPGSMIPVMYGNVYQIVQSPGFVVITYEIIHEARVIPLDGRPHVGAGHPRAHGRRARPLGRRHARRRDDELHRRRGVPRRQRRDAAASPSASRGRRRTGSRGPRRSTIPATWTAPWTIAMPLTRGSAARCWRSSATRATTACATSSAPRGPKTGNRGPA